MDAFVKHMINLLKNNLHRTMKFFAFKFLLFALITYFPVEIYANEILTPLQLKQYISGKKKPPKDLQIIVRVASVAPEGSSWYNYAINEIIPEVSKLSNGLLKLKLYAGGVMGDEADTIRKMKMGQLQLLGVTNMGLTMMVPELSVLSLPFLFDWEPDLHYSGRRTGVDFILEKLEPTIDQLSSESGYQFLGLLETCFESLGTQVPIQSVNDLKEIKFWLWRGDRVRSEINEVLGIKTMPMELYDVSQGLATGTIDTTQVAWYVSVVLQWWPHIKYVTDYPLYGYESAALIADKRTFSNIEKFADKWGHLYGIKSGSELVRSFLKLSDIGFTDLRFIIRQDESKARERLLKEGIKEVHFPENELDQLKEKIEEQYYLLAEKKKYPKAILDEILLYREQYRKLKTEGKLNDTWYKEGIMPDGEDRNEWRLKDSFCIN